MAWGDDWLSSDYRIKNADVQSLYDACVERAGILSGYGFPSDHWKDIIDASFPLGVTAYHDPSNLLHPNYRYANLQNEKLWNNLHYAVETFIGAAGTAGMPAAFNLDNDIAGKAITDDRNTFYGQLVSFFGQVAPGPASIGITGGDLRPDDYNPVGALRHAAGLATNYGRTPLNDSWRRISPRSVNMYALGDAVDIYGNPAADGQRAWAVNGVYSYAVPFGQTGRLMQYDSAAHQWKFRGQADGEMPDRLDSTLAPPHNIPPGTISGDYITRHLLNEIKQCLRKLKAWGWLTFFTDLTASQYGPTFFIDKQTKFGYSTSADGNVTYAGAKSDGVSRYNATAIRGPYSGFDGYPEQFSYVYYTPSDPPVYNADLGSRRSYVGAPFNNTKARALRWYVGAKREGSTPFYSATAADGYDFDNGGLSYVTEGVYRLFALEAPTTRYDPPGTDYSGGDLFIVHSPLIGQLNPTVAFAGTPPTEASGGKMRGWIIPLAVPVADYSAALTYT